MLNSLPRFFSQNSSFSQTNTFWKIASKQEFGRLKKQTNQRSGFEAWLSDTGNSIDDELRVD